MSDDGAPHRAAVMKAMIPRPPADLAPLRIAFSQTVLRQWQKYVPQVLAGCTTRGISDAQFAKGRFIAEMYARACYSMLLVSRSGPLALRLPIRTAAILPVSRRVTLRLGSALLDGMEYLLPARVHRQLLLTSALMGMLDVVLDATVRSGEAAALRVASLIARPGPTKVDPAEQIIVALARGARWNETAWQTEYWERVLQPAVHNYCQAEVFAAMQIPDPTAMGHRWAGIEAAIKGMWYVVGPQMGLQGDLSRFEQKWWNGEQRWMADTSLLMQMIDDWVDQDEDRGARLTAVTTGEWTVESASALYDKTIGELKALLDASGILKPVFQTLLADLYRDYLHAAIGAMHSGLAA